MLSAGTRLAIAAVATLMLLGGLGAIAVGGSFGVSGLWLVIAGAVALVALAVERNRYRSEAAETSFESAGPGGGEPSKSSTRASRRRPRPSSIRRPTPRCGSSSTVGRASGATSPTPDATQPLMTDTIRATPRRRPPGDPGRPDRPRPEPRPRRRSRAPAPGPAAAARPSRTSTESCPGSSSTPAYLYKAGSSATRLDRERFHFLTIFASETSTSSSRLPRSPASASRSRPAGRPGARMERTAAEQLAAARARDPRAASRTTARPWADEVRQGHSRRPR